MSTSHPESYQQLVTYSAGISQVLEQFTREAQLIIAHYRSIQEAANDPKRRSDAVSALLKQRSGLVAQLNYLRDRLGQDFDAQTDSVVASFNAAVETLAQRTDPNLPALLLQLLKSVRDTIAVHLARLGKLVSERASAPAAPSADRQAAHLATDATADERLAADSLPGALRNARQPSVTSADSAGTARSFNTSAKTQENKEAPISRHSVASRDERPQLNNRLSGLSLANSVNEGNAAENQSEMSSIRESREFQFKEAQKVDELTSKAVRIKISSRMSSLNRSQATARSNDASMMNSDKKSTPATGSPSPTASIEVQAPEGAPKANADTSTFSPASSSSTTTLAQTSASPSRPLVTTLDSAIGPSPITPDQKSCKTGYDGNTNVQSSTSDGVALAEQAKATPVAQSASTRPTPTLYSVSQTEQSNSSEQSSNFTPPKIANARPPADGNTMQSDAGVMRVERNGSTSSAISTSTLGSLAQQNIDESSFTHRATARVPGDGPHTDAAATAKFSNKLQMFEGRAAPIVPIDYSQKNSNFVRKNPILPAQIKTQTPNAATPSPAVAPNRDASKTSNGQSGKILPTVPQKQQPSTSDSLEIATSEQSLQHTGQNGVHQSLGRSVPGVVVDKGSAELPSKERRTSHAERFAVPQLGGLILREPSCTVSTSDLAVGSSLKPSTRALKIAPHYKASSNPAMETDGVAALDAFRELKASGKISDSRVTDTTSQPPTRANRDMQSSGAPSQNMQNLDSWISVEDQSERGSMGNIVKAAVTDDAFQKVMAALPAATMPEVVLMAMNGHQLLPGASESSPYLCIGLSQPVRLGRSNVSRHPNFMAITTTQVISRNHLELFERHGIIYVQDVGSNSGTWVNGERLSNLGKTSEPQALKTGDVIRLGVDFKNDGKEDDIRYKCIEVRAICRLPVTELKEVSIPSETTVFSSTTDTKLPSKDSRIILKTSTTLSTLNDSPSRADNERKATARVKTGLSNTKLCRGGSESTMQGSTSMLKVDSVKSLGRQSSASTSSIMKTASVKRTNSNLSLTTSISRYFLQFTNSTLPQKIRKLSIHNPANNCDIPSHLRAQTGNDILDLIGPEVMSVNLKHWNAKDPRAKLIIHDLRVPPGPDMFHNGSNGPLADPSGTALEILRDPTNPALFHMIILTGEATLKTADGTAVKQTPSKTLTAIKVATLEQVSDLHREIRLCFQPIPLYQTETSLVVPGPVTASSSVPFSMTNHSEHFQPKSPMVGEQQPRQERGPTPFGTPDTTDFPLIHLVGDFAAASVLPSGGKLSFLFGGSPKSATGSSQDIRQEPSLSASQHQLPPLSPEEEGFDPTRLMIILQRSEASAIEDTGRLISKVRGRQVAKKSVRELKWVVGLEMLEDMLWADLDECALATAGAEWSRVMEHIPDRIKWVYRKEWWTLVSLGSIVFGFLRD